MIKKIKIHFVGISGIGMSGIAELMHDKGYKVQGSDINFNENSLRLIKKGIKVLLGHNKKNIINSDVIVYSSAIKKNNPELVNGLKLKIPILSRADMLAELMKSKKSIAIAGSQGKTTTTSIIGNILDQANFDPTIVNGGIINSYSKNNRYGKGDWMVVEADESDGSFLKLPHEISIITNLDIEHLDFYQTKLNLIKSFEQFINKLPFYGTSIICYDDKNLKKIISKIKNRKIISYSIKNKKADIYIYEIKNLSNKTSFKIKDKNNLINIETKNSFIINSIGNHNVLNAAASIIACSIIGVKRKYINQALTNYIGVKRRFTFIGKKLNAAIIDDYAHHPTEIIATLSSAKILNKNLIVIFQPHRFTRTNLLKNEFINVLSKINNLILLKTYSAGEKVIKGATSKDLFIKIYKKNRTIKYLEKDSLLNSYLIKYIKNNCLIIFMGAGSITKLAKDFMEFDD